MASSEGQTELLTGWSCVVHQPSEDPEPSELPSTVDITAFSAGLNVEPSTNTQNDDCSDSESESESGSNNSGSDGSGSCTVSDSSDSDSSSSSSSSRSSSPEFSVTSQPNGLRLTIATVRKSCGSPVAEKPSKSDSKAPVPDKGAQKVCKLSSSSDSHDSESGSESGQKTDKSEGTKAGSKPAKDMPKKGIKLRVKQVEKKPTVEKKVQKKEVVSPKGGARKSRTKKKKMASLPLSRSSTSSSSESDESEADSAMLASCSLQEIRQEDLAAILPDQQECDAFGAFEETERNSPQAGDASGSDMELPQQAVNALIQRTTESSSESESHPPPNPSTLYANSLLQQFVAQTQMLSTSTNPQAQSDAPTSSSQGGASNAGSLPDSEIVKRKRGRPKKVHKNQNTSKSTKKPIVSVEYCADPNVSPDSGIQNSPDHVSSPECSPLPVNKTKYDHVELKRTPMDRLKNVDKCKNNENRHRGANNLNTVKEQPKLAVTSNSFDRILYGNTDRVLYPPRRKAGRPPVNRKGPGRPPKHRHVTATVETKQVIPKILTKSDSKKKNNKHTNIKEKESSRVATQTSSNSVEQKPHCTKDSSKLTKPPHLHETCERVTKRLDVSPKITEKVRVKEEILEEDSKTKDNVKSKTNKPVGGRSVLANKNKIDRSKNKYLMLKNAKLMHSKHKHKKHKKCKFKILKPVTATLIDPKLNTEIEKLVQDFVKLCNISPAKPAKENVPEILKVLKKVSKKRKTSEYGDRKKKKQSTTTSVNKEPSSNEQRLPLKKRHYHLTTSNDNRQESQTILPKIEEDDSKNKLKNLIPVNKTLVEKKVEVMKTPPQNSPKQLTVIKTATTVSPKVSGINNNEYEVKNAVAVGSHIDEAIEACITKYSGPKTSDIKVETSSHDEVNAKVLHTPITGTTPKKRHRLEMANMAREKEKLAEQVKQETTIESVVSEIKMKRNLTSKLSEAVPKKTDATVQQMNTRKKNRLEDLTSNLVSKISESTTDPQNPKRKKEIKNEDRATVIKYPACKKVKPIEPDKLPDESPTGIFTPTVDLEINLPAKESTVSEDVKPKILITPANNTSEEKVKPTVRIENRKKIRKRRAINRTGFPTVKRKKKKIPVEIEVETKPSLCDRVPKDGEEYSSFVERTEKTALSEIEPPMELYNVTKWEVLSECDSLPQDERIDFDSFDVKQERLSHKNSSDGAPSDVVKRRRDFTPDTQSSELDDLTLEARIEKMRKNHKHKRKREVLGRKCNKSSIKRRLRDVSPASSIEPYIEKRIRDERASASGDECRKNKRTPRWRKRYLVAGLFSEYFKEDDETTKQKRNDLASKTKIVYNPQEHPYGLLPAPYHCGKYLRCRKIPFQLPHDLWWQHTHSQLAGRDLVPSWNYRKIRTNVYNVKNTTGACEPQSCNCSNQTGCGDDCINRLVLAECPGSHKCKNQKIQKHEWSPGIEKFMTENKGWGVKTNLPIKNGDFILEYVGEVVSDQEFKERMATRYVHDTHHYCLHLDGGLVIDGHRMGGDGRFVNHSCQPNCEMQKWSVNAQFRMALFALRDIKAGEELTYDYNFSLFNPAEGQECKCGSEICRGVIGGKSQRVRQVANVQNNVQPGRVGRPRKNQAKKATNSPKEVAVPPQIPPPVAAPHVKPMSHSQKLFVLEHHCFLLRNLKKLKKSKDKGVNMVPVPRASAPASNNQSTTFLNHLNALRQPRNMRTRRLAQAEEDPELKKTVQLANVLRDIWHAVSEAKDEKKEKLAAPFMYCPSKRRVPDYYTKIPDPIDLTTIEQNIGTGVYKTLESFDADMNKLFSNNMKFYGRSADNGIASARLKKIYNEVKKENLPKFENVLGVKAPTKFVPSKKKGEEEDIIRCICGMYRDEGLMIQCERCLVWQHCECVHADENAPSYHCETCVPRKVDYEISMDEYTEHGHQYYMTLMRGDLQLRQGDTVYVLRDIPIPGTDKKHTYDTIGEIKYTDLDIFRIERLWKDCKSGQRFAYGHHYLRPHETYHEPTRRFFQNEVMRVPLYEAVPVELVISHCWVMDPNTYCKGRPIGAPEEHIYICEYRVDKSARLFSKVSRSKFPTCTKTYAFERFDTRLKITRTYTPHDLDPALMKHRGRKPQEVEEIKEVVVVPIHIQVPIVRTRADQKARLNGILLNLLSKMPTKHVLDISYLLEGGRRRKKHT